jgi:hypothetical protein
MLRCHGPSFAIAELNAKAIEEGKDTYWRLNIPHKVFGLGSARDQLFSTFPHRPGQVPQRLGVPNRAEYPAGHEWMKLLLFPFRSSP